MMKNPASRGDDRGIALVMAMGVLGIAALVIALIVTYAINTVRGSGQDRQRTTAISTAEAGVDATFRAIQISPAGALPCSQTGLVQQAPRNASWTTQVRYTSALVPTPHCPLTSAEVSAGVALNAAITSTGTLAQGIAGQQSSARAMQGLVNLRPKPDFGAAILSFGTLTLDNRTRVNSRTDDPADVYSRLAFACSNSERFSGSVYSQASISFSNSCSAVGDVWATSGVSSANGSNGTIGGQVLTVGGDIDIRGTLAVTGVLQGKTTINYSACPNDQKCFPNAVVPPPPFPPAFPGLLSSPAALAQWQAAPEPYRILRDADIGIATCSGTAVETWVKANAATLPQHTLLLTSCAVSFDGTKDVNLAKNLAIFSSRGFTSSRQVTFGSTSSTRRDLYFVVPADVPGVSGCPGTTHDITTDNNFATTSSVNLLVYTPCNIDYSNSSTQTGQIYGGKSVTIRNQFTLDFQALPVYGVDPGTVSAASYLVDVVAKREVRR